MWDRDSPHLYPIFSGDKKPKKQEKKPVLVSPESLWMRLCACGSTLTTWHIWTSTRMWRPRSTLSPEAGPPFSSATARVVSECLCSPGHGGVLSGSFHAPVRSGTSSPVECPPPQLLPQSLAVFHSPYYFSLQNPPGFSPLAS